MLGASRMWLPFKQQQSHYRGLKDRTIRQIRVVSASSHWGHMVHTGGLLNLCEERPFTSGMPWEVVHTKLYNCIHRHSFMWSALYEHSSKCLIMTLFSFLITWKKWSFVLVGKIVVVRQYHCGIKRESGLTAGRRRIRPLLVVRCRVFIPASIHTERIEMTQLVVFICLCTHMCLSMCVCVYVCLRVCLHNRYNQRKISLRIEGTWKGLKGW